MKMWKSSKLLVTKFLPGTTILQETTFLPGTIFQVSDDQDREKVPKKSDGSDDNQTNTLDPKPDAVLCSGSIA